MASYLLLHQVPESHLVEYSSGKALFHGLRFPRTISHDDVVRALRSVGSETTAILLYNVACLTVTIEFAFEVEALVFEDDALDSCRLLFLHRNQVSSVRLFIEIDK